MNVEVTALIKYLWAILIPVIMKGWNVMDNKFKTADDRLSSVEEKTSDMNADIKVLMERTEKQDTNLAYQKEKIDKIYDLLLKAQGK